MPQTKVEKALKCLETEYDNLLAEIMERFKLTDEERAEFLFQWKNIQR